MAAERRQQQQQAEVACDDQRVSAQDGSSGAGRSPIANRLALLAALVLVALPAALATIGDLRAAPRATIVVLLAAALAHAVFVMALARTWELRSERQRRLAVAGILAVAVLLRLPMLFVSPSLSDDIYRYRWDGKVQAAGLNPYAEPPAATALEPLRDDDWTRINYPRIRTIYPPLSQALFRLTYGLHHSLVAFQTAALIGDVLVLLALVALLRTWALPPWYLALYACHPLPAVEFAGSGHFDAWAIVAVLAAVLAHERRRAALSTTALAAGILLKTWPLVFVPLMLRRRPRWHIALLGGLVAGGFAVYADAGWSMLQPWFDYTGRWRFNDGLFFALRHAGGSLEAGKALAAGLGLGLLWWLWRRDVDPVRGGYWLLIGFILLMPTVHPWYLLWALPLAALALDIGWVALCSLAPLAYWILTTAGADSNAWVEPTWPRFLEYLPALAVWGWQSWRQGYLPAPRRTRGADEP